MSEVTEQTRKVFNAAWYVLLFFLGFLIFFLFTFPYGVLKEAIVSEISQATGFTVRVKEMGPSFLVGVDASGVRISTADGSAQMELKSMDASVSLLSLFIGQAKVNVELVSRNNGTLDTSVSWGIWQLLVDKNYVPKHISLEAKDFELGGIVNVALAHSAKTANDMIKDLLVQLIFQGNLSGQSEIKLAIDDPLQSSGDVELKIDKASLDLANPTLVVAKQNFKRAIVKASLKGGRLQIDNKSGFETQEIKTDVRGVVSLKNPFQNSILDITIPLKLEGTLKDNFGFILSVVGGSEGQLNYKISGSIARPAFEGSGG